MDFIGHADEALHRAGRYASWIAPPRMGINQQPGEFEYVESTRV
jgi:benzoyl-CoA 2,3-dioxygenase component B